MKFPVTFKDPDTLHESILHAVRDSLKGLPLSDEERKAVFEIRCEQIQEQVAKWFECGEYLSVEIDTDAGTCTVLEVER